MKRDFKTENLHRMAVFAEVVQQGSMSAAARSLGMSPSGVSQQVRALERDGGVTLLHRSTRSLALTEAGERFYEHCAAMVEAARRAQRQLGESRDAPVGELRVSAPVGSSRLLSFALAPLLAAQPALELHLVEDDAMVDLIDERIDLALRFGRMADSNWVAQPLAEFEWVVCAAPAYLARQPLPAVPADLPALQWMADARHRDAGLAFEMHGPAGRVEPLRVRPRVFSNHLMSLQEMALQGIGVARLLRASVEDDLQAGRLMPLLPAWSSGMLPMSAVTPQRDTQPAKVRFAIEALRQALARIPGVRVPPAANSPRAPTTSASPAP